MGKVGSKECRRRQPARDVAPPGPTKAQWRTVRGLIPSTGSTGKARRLRRIHTAQGADQGSRPPITDASEETAGGESWRNGGTVDSKPGTRR